jgi:LPXTG-motif cell wall-anchored protein
MYHVKKGLISLFFLILSLLIPQSILAASVGFDIFPPEGQLTRGQDATFTITIDTKGSTINSTQIGLQYDTQYLEYVSFTPGDTMTTVSAQNIGGGKILFSGSDSAGYKGNGKFAYITFKIIATAPGSTNLCTLFAPTSATTAPAPTGSTPLPTKLPTTGFMSNTYSAAAMGSVFLVLAGYLLVASRTETVESNRHNLKKRKST